MKNIALIPARSGSKGFKNKNIAKLAGKTLIELAVNVAVKTNKIDDVYISTDSNNYEKIAKDNGAKSLGLRPKSLSGDKVKTIDVVIDFLRKFPEQISNIILLQPSSPIRTPDQINKMIEKLTKNNSDAIVSIEEIIEPHPHKMKTIKNGYISEFIDGTSSEVPRQLLPEAFKLTGSVYVNSVKSLLEQKTFLPKKTLGYQINNTINIDSENDYILIKALYEQNKIDIYGI